MQELTYQLEQTNAKVIICHEENLDTALAAAQKVNIPKKNIFIFGDKPIKGVQPFQTALIKFFFKLPTFPSHQNFPTHTNFQLFYHIVPISTKLPILA